MGIKAETVIIGFVIISWTPISRCRIQIRFRLPSKTHLPRIRNRGRLPTVKIKEKYKKTSLNKSSLLAHSWLESNHIITTPSSLLSVFKQSLRSILSWVVDGSFTLSIFNSLQISRLPDTPKFPQLQFQEIQEFLPEPADFAPKLSHQGSILQWNCRRRLCSRRRPSLDRFPPRFAGNSLI